MPTIWMDVDIALSEVPVNMVPLIDDTDFKTVEEGVAFGDVTLYWHFTKTDGTTTVTSVTATAGGLHDWAHQDNGLYTIEIPTAAGDINNTEEGFGWFTGTAAGILPWTGPVIGFRAAGLNNLLIDSAYSATRGLSGTALPDAAANGAGGLPISDAGGLDLDTQIGTDIDAILTDTGTTLDTLIKDIPTVAEFEARTLVADDYVVVGDTIAGVTVAGSVSGNVDGNVTGSVGSLVGHTVQTGDTYALAAGTTGFAAIDTVVDAILVDTGTTLENHLTDIKGTGFAKDTHSLPQCLTATGFSTHDAADVKTAIEAGGSSLAAIKTKTDGLNFDGNNVLADVMAIADIDFSATMKTSLDTACDTVTVTSIGANVITATSMNADASAEIITALKASTGWTAGGTMTMAEVVKCIAAAVAGNYADDPVSGFNYKDVEDGITDILDETISGTSPYRDITVK